jgi:hypothetical protein
LPNVRSSRLKGVGLFSVALVPFFLVGVILWTDRGFEQGEQFAARHRALDAARSIGSKIDLHLVRLEYLLQQLSGAVSTNSSDVVANDELLRRVKSEQPSSIANILLLALDGRNIGNAEGQHASAGDRDYFQKVRAGEPFVVGDPIRSRSNLGWVVPIARPVRNSGGEVQAVLVVAIFLDGVRELIDTSELPIGWLAKIVDSNGIELASISTSSATIDKDFNRTGNPIQQLSLEEGSEVVNLASGLQRVVGFSRTHRAAWLVVVGLPIKMEALQVAKGQL